MNHHFPRWYISIYILSSCYWYIQYFCIFIYHAIISRAPASIHPPASDPSSISIHPGSAVMASGGVEIYLPQSHDLAIFQHCNRISFGLFRLDFLFGGSPLLQRNGPCTIYPCSSSSFSSDSISQIPSCILRMCVHSILPLIIKAGSLLLSVVRLRVNLM